MNGLCELFYNILFNPSEAFKNISCEKAYKLPLLIIVISSFFMLNLSESTFNAETIFIFLTRTFNLIIYWLFFSFFINLIARTFNKENSFSKVLSLTAFAYVPWIFLGPLTLLKNSVFSNLGMFLILIVWAWTIILQIIAISEIYNIPRKNALIILIIPFLATILYIVWSTDFFIKLFQILVL